ncbi:MAG: hypothetical protein HYY30_03500 [Chloroflexi bacterium]|nr:hypothetical protein [Chloroflexota bacterium]
MALLTTFLLLWGLFGLLVLYAIFINLVILTSRLLGFALGLLGLASPWLAKGSAAMVAIAFALIRAALALLKWTFETLGIVGERVFELLGAMLDLIIYPIAKPARGVNRYFRE